MIQIQQRTGQTYAPTALGFRPFFLLSMAAAVLMMLAWMAAYFTSWKPNGIAYSILQWHGHEMVFGYGLAVISGFLLTAERNWTGVQTPQGDRLIGLFSLWLVARVLPIILGPGLWWLGAVADLAFNIWLTWEVTRPILIAKQWNQSAFPGKVALLTLANLAFYLGVAGIWTEGLRIGLYLGFYLILAVIFTMGRRVIPFFIEKGVNCPFQARNSQWLDRASLWLFLVFMVVVVIAPASPIGALLGVVLFALHAYRLQGWYTSGIWPKSLLWGLFAGYGFIVVGFLLHALALWLGWSPFLAIHAFAVGGIGLITSGMMARVSLGHTGRDVANPPVILHTLFALLLLSALVRVVLPLLIPAAYASWIFLAQLLWIAAFAGLFWLYAPILVKSRIDGMPG